MKKYRRREDVPVEYRDGDSFKAVYQPTKKGGVFIKKWPVLVMAWKRPYIRIKKAVVYRVTIGDIRKQLGSKYTD